MNKLMLHTALFTTGIYAAEDTGPTYSSMSMIAMMLFLAVLSLLYLEVYHYRKKFKIKNELLKEKDEKIKWLRQISAENEHRNSIKAHETEKLILELKHTIETLETKAKEGTKNQVAAKIEAQQNTRARQLERADLRP